MLGINVADRTACEGKSALTLSALLSASAEFRINRHMDIIPQLCEFIILILPLPK